MRVTTMKITKAAFALIVCLMLATPARATILFAGGEDSDFINIGSASIDINSGYFATGYAREGLLPNNGSVTDPPGTYWLSPTFTAGSTLWLHTNFTSQLLFGNNAQLIGVLSPDGVARILVRGTGSNLIFKISTRNAAGTITDLVTASSGPPTNALATFDLFINYSATGEVSWYVNGVRVADYTGNVLTDSATQLNQFRVSADAVNDQAAFSELIAATTNTTALRLVTLAPVANGATDTFDVGGVSNVNEVALNDSTVNASGTASQIQLYTVGALPTNNLQIADVVLSARAQVDTTGPQHLQAMVRTASTNYNSASLAPTQSTWGPTWIDFPNNPNTSVAWTASDLSAAGFNIGYESVL